MRGCAVGAYLSPHVRGWSERIRIRRRGGRLRARVARVRSAGRTLGATQFEALTAAALAGVRRRAESTPPSSRRGSAAGTTRRTCSPRASSCSRTSRSTTWTCWGTRARRSPPRSSRSCTRAATVVLGDAEWEELARASGGAATSSSPAAATSHSLRRRRRRSSARDVDPHAAQDVELPGRLERRGERPLEIWDGAHNLAGVGYLLPRLPGPGATSSSARSSPTSGRS